MQNQSMNSSNMGGFVAPPPLPDYQPPPPPPPAQSMQPSEIPAQPVIQTQAQTHNLQQPPPKVQTGLDKSSDNPSRLNETQTLASAQAQERNFSSEQPNLQHHSDGFRRNNRNSRWGNDNSNNSSGGNTSGSGNRNNRVFGGHTNFESRKTTSYDDHASNDHANDEEKEEKSQEEIQFDINYQKWEDQLAEWKRNNANHPDRNQYNDFVSKMEGCRKQLLLKRESLRQNRLERKRNAHLAQNSQSNATPQDMNNAPTQVSNKDEISAENSDRKNTSQVTAETKSLEQGESVASSLFSSERCDSKTGTIPGLDLVSGDNKLSQPGSGLPTSFNAPPKCESKQAGPDSNLVAHVTNILGNPEIQSLLSNIQKQKNESATLQTNTPTRNYNESGGSGMNVFNRSENFGQFDKQQNTDAFHRNPFRQNTPSDDDMNVQNVSDYNMNPKRGRYDFDRFDRFTRFDRDRNDQFTQVNKFRIITLSTSK